MVEHLHWLLTTIHMTEPSQQNSQIKDLNQIATYQLNVARCECVCVWCGLMERKEPEGEVT